MIASQYFVRATCFVRTRRVALKLPFLAGALAGCLACTSNATSPNEPSTVETFPVTANITLTLVDASTDSDVRLLQNGDVIALDEFVMGLSVRADTTATNHQSARFSLNGSVFSTENFVPYAIAGDRGGDYRAWNPAPGEYEIGVKLYSEDRGAGETLGAHNITVEIVATNPNPNPAPAPDPNPAPAPDPDPGPAPDPDPDPAPAPDPDPQNPPGTHPDIVTVRTVAGRNPRPNWRDSYSVGDKCYCDSTFDHNIGSILVDTPRGRRTVREVCDAIGPGPGRDGRPVYNDIQCGNGPPNDAGDEDDCPGRVDIGRDGCGHIGPRWDLSVL